MLFDGRRCDVEISCFFTSDVDHTQGRMQNLEWGGSEVGGAQIWNSEGGSTNNTNNINNHLNNNDNTNDEYMEQWL